MSVTVADGVSTLEISGIAIEMLARGKGRPVLFLHPENGIAANAPVLDRLTAAGRVLAPSHPGFGRSEVPKTMMQIDDLAYFYLDLLDTLDLTDTFVIGIGFGAWIAAEIAIKSTQRLARLVMADAFGIKIGDRESRDIADFLYMTEEEYLAAAYFDAPAAKRDYTKLPETELVAIARNREASARFGWSPFMHDPKLKGRLHRIRIPTLFLWGAADRIVTPEYGRAYCAAIPGARFELIERAGHFPHLEQNEEFARLCLAFAEAK
jgi:pimeloyl-ACP methyl ester carboxylesterase